LKRERVLALYSALRAANPEPRSELEFRTPFELLVAVILSAQATDKSVNIATRQLYNTKAMNVIETCRLLLEQHGGEVPRDREALEALPGVGRKTANVVLNVAFGEPTLAVDTHVFRVANRTGLAPGKTPLAVEAGLLKVTPAEFMQHAHHWLILHGRHVCVARTPKCPQCAIAPYCAFKPKTKADTR
jgi:endonuclease III